MSKTRSLPEKPYQGHVFNFLEDLTGGLVPFFRAPANFTLAPTYETINRIYRT